MEILGDVNNIEKQEDEETGECLDSGDIYELVRCPACKRVMVLEGFWHDSMDPSDWHGEVIYPESKPVIPGLPQTVRNELDAAQRVATLSPNAYAVLLGRALDLVCADRGAAGDSLFNRLEDLGKKGEIPGKLVELAHGLRQLRNIGAHADLGSLTSDEIPVLDALCRAILEYIYRAPSLVALVEQRLKTVKTKKARPAKASGT
jgi:hypothetical protein